jgi:hypothetical protein
VVLKNTDGLGVAKQQQKKHFLLKVILNLLGFLSGRLLGEKHRVNVGENATLRDGDSAKKLVKLLVVADGKLDVAGDTVMRLFLLSRAALPASSRISAVKYSRTEARYTGAPAPTLGAYLPFFKYLPIRPTGN